MSNSAGDEHYKLLIDNILHNKKKYPFLGHNRVLSAPVTESVELSPNRDTSIPVESYAFLLEELGSWKSIYENLFSTTLEDLTNKYSHCLEQNPIIESSSTLRILPSQESVESEDIIDIGASKSGGRPDLPDSIVWPLNIESIPANFVAQINLDDLRKFHSPKNVLPPKGWLFFFVGCDDFKHSQDMKQPFSFYWDGPKSDLKRREPPNDTTTETPMILHFGESSEQLDPLYPSKIDIYCNTIQLFGHSIYHTYPATTMLFCLNSYIFLLESEIELRKRKGVQSLINRYERRGRTEYEAPSKISILSQDWYDNDGQSDMFVSSFPCILIHRRYKSVAQNRVTDWDSNLFDPPFVRNFKPITNQCEPAKIWRRKDVLVPGQEIQAPKTLVHANFMKEEPVTEWTDESLSSTVLNNDKCIRIDSILNDGECRSLRAASLPFYTDIESEYPKEYRNCERALLKSQKLADLLWERIKPYLNENDFKNVKPYGFDNSGIWKPIGINECFRFSAYKPDTYFKPHKDAQFVRNDNEKSIFTVLLYLNSVRQGGSTTFLHKFEDQTQDGSEITFRVIHEEEPLGGTVMIFNHDLYHQGSKVNHQKMVIRSEIIFQRVDVLSVPRSDYRNKQEYQKVEQLVKESNELEKQGDTKQSLLKYLKALDLQTSMSPSLQWSDLSDKSALERLPEEIIGLICSYLTSREISTLMLPLSALLNSYSRSPPIWKEKYNQEWRDEEIEEVDEVVDEMDENEILFCEKTEIVYQRNSVIYNSFSGGYKDWYAAFVSRITMEKFWAPVLLDPGRSSYRFGLQNSTSFKKSPMICSTPNHTHFNLPGFGLHDILAGTRATAGNAYLTSELPLVDNWGRIENFQNFRILLFQLYVNDLDVKFQNHPLVLAVPFSWSEEDKSKVKDLVFNLGIPLACFVDSSKLIAYNYSKPNCLLLNISSSGCACVPIRNYEPNNGLKVYDVFKARTARVYIDFWDNIYGVFRMATIVPPTDPDAEDENEDKWHNFNYEEYVSIRVAGSYSPISFGYDRLYDGNQIFLSAFEVLTSVIESIENTEEKEELLKNILVCGGFSSLYGMKERLTREIGEIYPNANLEFESNDMEVIGGAKIFANLSNFKEYLESHPSK